MKTTIIIFSILLFTGYGFAQAPDWQWASQAGGLNYDVGNGVGIDSAGNSYVTGYFKGTTAFGSHSLTSNGVGDIFVAKADTLGIWQWAKRVGGNASDYGYSISTDANGYSYITGFFQGTATFGSNSLTSIGGADIFVAKIDSTGTWQWAKRVGGSSSDYGNSIVLDSNGCIYITGRFRESMSFGSFSLTSNGSSDIFIAKMDSLGNWLWATQAGGIDNDTGYGITTDNTGRSFVTGDFSNIASFGSFTLTSFGLSDAFVGKIDSLGSWEWVTKAGSIENDRGYSITIDSNRNTYIHGYFAGSATFGSLSLNSYGGRDIFIAKVDTFGVWDWVTQSGGTGDDEGKAITIDSAGDCCITGCFENVGTFGTYTLTSFGSEDIFTGKINSDGIWQWVTQAGGVGNDRGFGICVDTFRNIYPTGYFSDIATFGSHTQTSYGERDIFLAKIEENNIVANFEADTITGYLPISVNFADLSLGNISNWSWDFENDGIYDSFEQNPEYSYDSVGIFSVKLKISNETFVDSLIKENYITVDYCPPSSPQNVDVEIIHPDAVVSWTEVDTTECGSSITPDGYIIIYSEDEVDYLFLNYTSELNYIHTFVAQFRPQMFYQIIAFKDYNRTQIEYLNSLSNSREKVKWSEVKQNLYKMRK